MWFDMVSVKREEREREREFRLFRGLHGPEVTVVSSQPAHREDKAPGVNLINRINFTGTVIRRTFTFLRAKANGRRLGRGGVTSSKCGIPGVIYVSGRDQD